ncbi:PREDICTED: tyrosine-protein phosphatase non-receptor type 14 [Thamnophis sirtalis]|uniref:Tyrosine-protein phosphatase non-receptor type n=1 Tax=Thamnophis sirtalis TaxID=35019 RepID=A0A6I9X207_9SAUR|nr:PREDICTED: tyrosine-protein phosphatase non-receptor type 14 [Thamnophis sirtalis]
MPFGLKLRRTRRYNVRSKNSFMTRIQLLENNLIECTLSVESTGQECLEAVGQKLELPETHYFGLWFHNKSQQVRWVELEKPLKKQLDKFASQSLLFFGVMFYVPSVALLQHEVTRYQYYLQVKKDVIDGRLRSSFEQGIRLAALAVQATLAAQVGFGDYPHFDSRDLRRYVLFPVDLVQNEAILEELIQKVVQEHRNHSNLSAAEAELLYIREVERLDGFGQDSFPVKDNQGNDFHLGIFCMGIFLKNPMGRSTVNYRWNDIGNITHNKSSIVVELVNKEETVLFHTDDLENAKYISRLFAAKHKFYKQNKICTEQSNSPPPIRRRPTWSRSSLPRQHTFIMPPVHVQCGEHYTETHNSQDSIFHGNEDMFYYRSQTSLDRCAMDFSYLNGSVPNGSVCSAQSMNSLNHSQNFVQASPVSSNLSIPGSDIMRADYIPSHRHSAIIVPSYRPTPDYDTVMRQMKRGVIHTDSQSQSLRNLNIGNTHVYSQPTDLVYSQPEIQERPSYTIAYGPQGTYKKHMTHSEQVNPMNALQAKPTSSAISHTVSTPELANMQLPNNQRCGPAQVLKNYLFRPPPPYPRPRPATSTPDLASHRHKYVTGSSPDLVPRKVQLSVKTFQEDSAPVVHQSLQEVSEPLMAAKHHAAINKRHSLEVISNMVRGMEAMALKSLNAPLPRRNTLRNEMQPEEVVQRGHEVQQLPHYHHKKTFSDATMLIHSSESEDEEEASESVPSMAALHENMEYSVQLQAALARIPNKPPPEYPGPRKSVSNGALRNDQINNVPRAVSRVKVARPGPARTISISRTDQNMMNGSSLGPSISEPDLTSVKERVKKEPVKERPVSEMFSIEDSIIEREMRYLEKQKMAGLEAQKRPLMLAALNGLSVARVPVPEDSQDEGAKVPMDERERGRTKSHRYWPILGSKHSSATYGKFKVTTKFRTVSGCYATTGLKVKHLGEAQEKTVWHLHYTNWPDHTCPGEQDFLSYLEEIQSVRRHTNSILDSSNNCNPPIVVHCSAGVGRTGVVILTELMIGCLEHNEKVDVPVMLQHLREQRMFMIQTIAQYKFVYQVLILFLQNSRLI